MFVTTCIHAQEIDSAVSKQGPSFKLGVYYNTGLNYYGRTDSLRSSGFFPVAEIWLDQHFYLTAAPVFVINKSSNFDYAGTIAVAGYRFGNDRSYAANIYAVKPFYEDNSQLVQSALKAQFAASGTWLNKYLNFTFGGDIKLSDKTDFGLTSGLDHIARLQLTERSVLVIDPSVYVNAGTQQFTKTYYKQSSFLFFPGIQQQVTEEVSKFKILSYEFSMPVVFATGKLQLQCTPAYVVPQNLIQVEGRPDLSERGRSMFYATLGAKYSF